MRFYFNNCHIMSKWYKIVFFKQQTSKYREMLWRKRVRLTMTLFILYILICLIQRVFLTFIRCVLSKQNHQENRVNQFVWFWICINFYLYISRILTLFISFPKPFFQLLFKTIMSELIHQSMSVIMLSWQLLNATMLCVLNVSQI